MSVNATVTKSQTLGGVSFPESKTPTGDAMIVQNITVPAAEAGELTTRTSDTAGTLTMDDSAHTINTGDRLDLYWTGGSCRDALVGTVSGASVPFTGAQGDVLPIATTEIMAAVPVEVDVVVDGDNLVALLMANISAIGQAQIVLEDDGAAEAYFARLGIACSRTWHDADGTDNPIAGDLIEKAYLSHGGTAAAAVRLGMVYDN